MQTDHKHSSTIVVKDPVALTYHQLRPDEFFVLECLRPDATLESLRDQYVERYRPQRVTTREINDLLFRFHRLGFTLADKPEQGDRLNDKRIADRKQRWTQHITGVLFIRFPGVDPEPLLRRLYPLARPAFSATGIVVMLSIILAAIGAISANWDRFVSEMPAMQQWTQLRAILVLAAVIASTKVCHELGHAIVCKHFGGECHQIGPMLLVFTPALYCDTSDSWTLSNRFSRAAVGMAGIAVEILLASLATLVWVATGPSLIHYVAMNVMLVCSVSTLLFNANPLLRYDGYYVLSDLCDVPNLGPRSRQLLSKRTGELFFGTQPDADESIRGRERFWMLVYALAAFAYRWTLTFLILWFILVMLRPYRLESVGQLILLFAVAGLIYSTFRGTILFLRSPAQRKMIRMSRVMKSGTVIALLMVAAMWPLPSGESVTGRVVPRQETPVYVATGGHLDHLSKTNGQWVDQGELIAELVNPDTVLQYTTASSRVDTQQELVNALKATRLTLSESADDLPVAEAMLSEFQRQLETRRQRRDALQIRAPVSGRLIAPPKRSAPPESSELTLASWTGDPTEQRNRGCFIDPGTELFTVVADGLWDVELIASSGQIQRIRLGNSVKLVLDSDPSKTIDGVVTEISSRKWTSDENGERRDDQQASRETVPLETSYAVRVEIDAPKNPSMAGLIAGTNVSARITAEPISMLGRTTRFLNRLLRFR
ncbi:MAG: HlyD family efflux transporter periplasmic adaptor subunit [Planctomycetales bacterium]|nr:HlyD family efflux transporter periplasmic adaptor subunit [Planctomycetales bacterium]